MIIPVTCALIFKNQKVLAVRRSKDMPLPGCWEFPGGKMESDESADQCIAREIMEELNVEIKLGEMLPVSEHSYTSHKTIRLIPFSSKIIAGEIQLHEHDQLRWLGPNELFEVTWAAADIPIVRFLELNWNTVIQNLK
ncbi:MAG: (deoxy)nucleoside triphosphate pyrophosphohydrolase [Algoriphagus sp.]|uniref:(deoxy)nucleoside triphosphate pyrophosphohydrolase n=1 Tax=Algoriphagus sp. TaxID=1872435 RepID=UPI0018086B40|nr:(deoxy)nucleoside triphosphate pyrophosphohydrolase [Algoriphagus sp.]NVJ85864.1 (deoxy)nucleoside triphosphate pyrophosphohydrolase [Algoriphagus sp.]